jgi:hypothetical protein
MVVEIQSNTKQIYNIYYYQNKWNLIWRVISYSCQQNITFDFATNVRVLPKE